jgi:DNA-directed RNA polymerase I subunit RPA1
LATSKLLDNLKIEIEDEDNNKSFYIPGITFEHNTRLDKEAFGKANTMEGVVNVRDNELLTGVLDKNHIGNSEFGLVHSFYEIYGSTMAGELISTFGRLFISYLQYFHGFTCGVDDIILKDANNFYRRRDIENIIKTGMEGLGNFFEIKMNLEFYNYSRRNVFTRKTKDELAHYKMLPEAREHIEKLMQLQNIKIENLFSQNEGNVENEENVDNQIELSEEAATTLKELREKYYENILKDDSIEANIDTVIKNSINKYSSECVDTWLKGLMKTFPKNYFACMVQTGAKGSKVNHTQVTCMLGQQELEGRRVPRMASGRTLPSFEPFDPNPRSGGLITDRFSTGIRPQEFFFHCMAGREGLIDTAVKTSRSGYLQRCLIKHLEQLVVNYDYTVRDTDGNVYQFLYGEDSIDVINSRYLNNFKFISNNIETYFAKYKPERLSEKLDTKTIKKVLRENERNNETVQNHDPLLSKYELLRSGS